MVISSNIKSSVLLSGTAIAVGLILAGCLENNQRLFQTHPPPQAQPAADKTTQDTPGRYIRAQTTLQATNGFDFTQVSLFGDLPGLPATPYKSNAGPSLQQHTFAVEGACFDPIVSSDGQMLAFASTQHNVKPDIYIKPAGLATMTQLTDDPASEVQAVFSSNGKRVAFCSDRSGNWDVYAVDTTGGNLRQLTDDPAPEMHPSFSADGTQVAYCRYNLRAGRWEVWVMNLSDGQRRFITPGLFPTFSPTASRIVYQRAKQRGSRWFTIWTIELRGRSTSMPTEVASSVNRALTTPRWSADGRHIVYTAVNTQGIQAGTKAATDAQIWVVRADGTGKMPVTDPGIGCFTPSWSCDNRIFFCAKRGGCENIWSVLPMIGMQGSPEANTPTEVKPAG